MAKNNNVKKTLPEKVLEEANIDFEPFVMSALDASEEEKQAMFEKWNIKETDIYKTLALIGDKTGPLIGVVPLTQHLSEKKLAAVSGNKKVNMIPLKDLKKTTGYVHGANNPVGIWKIHNGKFPIFFDVQAQQSSYIVVSAGELGRSDKLDAKEVAQLIGAEFVNIATEVTS